MLARSTWLLVGLGRHIGDDDAKIRADVTAAIKEALQGDKPFTGEFDFGKGPELGITSAGVYRMAFDNFNLDRSNQLEQERWFRVVEKALADAISHEGPIARFYTTPGGSAR